MGFCLEVFDRVARDSTSGSDGSDRTGDGKAGQLGKVIEGASQSSMNEVLDAWGPPPKNNSISGEKPEDSYQVEKHGEHGEKLLIKAGVENQMQESLDTNQIGMMAIHGHPVAQAGAEMLKTPAAQDKEVRDGIKRDISSVLGDWFKERFHDVTNVVSGFDKWVTSTLNVQNLRNFGEGIRKAAFGHSDQNQEPAKITGNMENFHLKGVESPQDLAAYGVSTTVGAAKALSHAAPLLTPQGFAKANHDLAEGGREAINNAGEYYGEHGISKLPADTADATKTAYNRLSQWSADRMQMEPAERGDITGTAMATIFLIAGTRELIDENGLARRLGVGIDDVAGMSTAELEARGINKVFDNEITRQSVNEKVSNYLFNRENPRGWSKGEWFRKSLGFEADNSSHRQMLEKQIQFNPKTAQFGKDTEYGVRYKQEISITGPNGRTIDGVRAVWQCDVDTKNIRLITLMPPRN